VTVQTRPTTAQYCPICGPPGEGTAPARYCARCGQAVNVSSPPTDRFGESFCSEAHADEFVTAVRTARVQAAATGAVVAPTERPGGLAEGSSTSRGWMASLGKALCWGGPLVVLVFLLAGGGRVLGAGSGLLPVLAVLACPLGMLVMMRAMMKMGSSNRDGKGGDRLPGALGPGPGGS